jgi:hypothetical protein
MSRDARESLTALFAVAMIFGGFWLAIRLIDQIAIPFWLPGLLFGLNLITLAVVCYRVVRNRRRLPAAMAPPALIVPIAD